MSRSALQQAFGHVWVRAVFLAVAAVVVCFGLFFLGAALLEDGHRAIGWSVETTDMVILFFAVFLGPAWVVQPLMGPHGGGPPRGGIIPIPLKTPESVDGAGQEEEPSAAA